MPYPQLDRRRVKMHALKSRLNRKTIETKHIPLSQAPSPIGGETQATLDETIERIKTARSHGRPVMLTFGAHTIKNGLALVLIDLIEKGWVTHLATNGAGIIHDWEFAYLGESSENVKENVASGTFGNWQETGFFINLALIAGAYEGLGYGESVGALIEREALQIPGEKALLEQIRADAELQPERAAAAADLLSAVRGFQLPQGTMQVPHAHKRFSVQAAAHRKGVPFTGHPMIGHDIIYNHPMNHCAAIGRTAQRDFLAFAQQVSNLDGGVYLSVGSAVMSPMIFEKSMSLAQNLALQSGAPITNHFMCVVDLAKSTWNWTKGEPPENTADYYLRFCKSFSRMGGELRYACLDNRDFLLALAQGLNRRTPDKSKPTRQVPS